MIKGTNIPIEDTLPPHSVKAEMAVLGCCMMSPKDVIPRCVQKLKFEAFYDLRNQTLYDIFIEMYDAGLEMDLVTLRQFLKDRGILEEVGGIAYINSLDDDVPTTSHIDYYLDIVVEKYLLRRLVYTCTEVIAKVYDFSGKKVGQMVGESGELFDTIERDFLKISQLRVASKERTMKELVRSAINTIEDMHKRQGKITGIETGFIDYDKLTNGLQGGDVIIIAARPSMGKTSLAMNIAEHIAVTSKIPGGIFSLEMTAESLVLRMLCSKARVNLRHVRDGNLVEGDFPKFGTASSKLSVAPLYIDDTSGISILEFKAKARRMAQQYGIKFLVVDYIQLMHSNRKGGEGNRQQEVSDISSGIKALAKELMIPIIALSQLNRDLEREKGRKPRLSDLRESGSLEQDADVVGLLYRPKPEDGEEEPQGDAIPVNLTIAKQRNGETGEINMIFLKSLTRFESASKVCCEDVPT